MSSRKRGGSLAGVLTIPNTHVTLPLMKHKPITYEIDDKGCHICTSHAAAMPGYPVIRRAKKNSTVARYIYETYWGDEIPDGLCVMHSCDNRLCINPKHLKLGTIKENNQDMFAKGRGNYPGKARFTEEEAREILLDNTHTYTYWAKKYDVSLPTIDRMKKRFTYKWVTL